MAGGTFSTATPPNDPGFYINFESVATAVVTGGTNGVVLVPFTADWGPEATFVSVTSAAGYDATFSSSTSGTGRSAVVGALKGMGTRPGASSVLCYRLVGSTGSKGTLALRNAADSEDFVTLTAKYKGARTANWTVSVQANPINSGERDLIIYENSVEIERHSNLSATAPANWVSSITSSYVDVAVGAATDVDTVTGVSFDTDGDSGLSVTGSEYTAFQSAAESQTFNVVSPANLTDDTIRSAMVTWCASRNTSGQRFMLVIGGAAGETMDDAVTRSTTADNENVVSIGYTDLYDSDENTISTAEFAPRLAGVIADASVSRSITQQRITDVTLKVVPTADDLAEAYAGGVVTLVSDSVSPRIHQDMTTYTSNSLSKPRAEFGKIKAVRTHQQIESDLSRAAANGWLGGDNVNIPTVQTVILSGVSGYLQRLQDDGIVNNGWTVELDATEDNSGNALHLVYSVSTVKSIEQIFNTIVLS